jgi:hypothetical protein
MKKSYIYCFAALLFIFPYNLQAQFGVKLGIIQSNISYDAVANTDILKSAVRPQIIGVAYRLAPKNIIGVELGLQYVGIKEKSSDIILPDISLNYIAVPIAISLQPKSLVSPAIGLQFSALAGSKFKETFDQKTMDVSGFVSLSINPLDHFGLEVGYNHGLVPFMDIEFTNNQGQTYIDGDFKNRYLYLLGKAYF